jgi:signal transduction histidine kinase
MATDMPSQLIDRLASIPNLAGIPRKELKWIVENGHFAIYEVGTIIGPKGKRINNLWIILSGKIAIRVDRGVGPRLVTEWRTGEVTGMLPYSRMSGPPGDNYVEEKAELLAIDVKLFPKMIHHCPSFTAYTVHNMVDRARNFNTSDLQDEKMISLGKLSAGLAHELNNPASATVRDAKVLLVDLANMDAASRALGATSLTDMQFKKIEKIRAACLAKSDDSLLSPIQKSDHQDKITDWLVCHRLSIAFALPLADTSITIGQLDKLANSIPGEALDITLNWIVTSCTTHSLAVEIEHAATQIYKVVDAVKKFTYMGNLAEKEFVDVEPGIRDTISILISKAKSKSAAISLDMAKELPHVYANGSDLNQVWFSLLDNALDAISNSGNIRIEACSEMNRVVVRIVDDGPGIASDVISKIFDPFFTTKPPGHGTGLGLEITRRLLRQYQGDISVHSHPGRTEFRVSLLAAKPAIAPVNQNNEDIKLRR